MFTTYTQRRSTRTANNSFNALKAEVEHGRTRALVSDEPQTPRPELTDKEKAHEKAAVLASLGRTTAMRVLALSIACPSCGADPEVYCAPGVRGLCGSRVEAVKGQSDDLARRAAEARAGDEAERLERARIDRNVELHARQKFYEEQQRAQRAAREAGTPTSRKIRPHAGWKGFRP